MKTKIFVSISSGTFLIFAGLVFFAIYVLIKNLWSPSPTPSPLGYADLRENDSSGAPLQFAHFSFNEVGKCRTVLNKSRNVLVEKIDTFKTTGAVVKTNLLTMYTNKSNSRLIALDVSYLKTTRNCRLYVYIQKDDNGKSFGCNDSRKKCSLEIICKRKYLWGLESEIKYYTLSSDGNITVSK